LQNRSGRSFAARGSLSKKFRNYMLSGIMLVGPLAGCTTIRTPVPAPVPQNPVSIPVEILPVPEIEKQKTVKICLDALKIPGPVTKFAAETRLRTALELIEEKGGADGRALIDYIRNTAVTFCLEDLPENILGLYSSQNKTVILNKKDTVEQMATTLIHELVHAHQYKSGAQDKKLFTGDVYYAQSMVLCSEAAAEAVTIRILHEMKRNGEPQMWNSYKQNFQTYADMMNRYERVYNTGIRGGADHETAAQAAGEAAYAQFLRGQGRLDMYNLRTLTAVVGNYVWGVSPKDYTERVQTDADVRSLAAMPGAGNYSRNARALTEDQIFGQGPNAALLRMAVKAFDGYRKGDNTETNRETLKEYGMFAGLDFKAAYADFLKDREKGNLVISMLRQATEQGIPQQLLRNNVRSIDGIRIEIRMPEAAPGTQQRNAPHFHPHGHIHGPGCRH